MAKKQPNPQQTIFESIKEIDRQIRYHFEVVLEEMEHKTDLTDKTSKQK